LCLALFACNAVFSQQAAGSAEQNNDFSLNAIDNNDATTSSPAFRPSIGSASRMKSHPPCRFWRDRMGHG
jgi:hypothetical protein